MGIERYSLFFDTYSNDNHRITLYRCYSNIISYSLFLGNFFRFWHHQWCLRLGSLSIITVMAILGLKLNFGISIYLLLSLWSY